MNRTVIELGKKTLAPFKIDDHVRYSAVYRRYLRRSNSAFYRRFDTEYGFYRNLIPAAEGLLIFDVGANCGDKTEIFVNLGATVIAVEPDRRSMRTLSVRFRHEPHVVLEPRAISNKAGQADLLVEREGSGYNTLSMKWANILERTTDKHFEKHLTVPVTTLKELVDRHGSPYYIKIDVEGFEQPALTGLETMIPLLSFEANLPEFLPETLCGMEHVRSLCHDARFAYITDRDFRMSEPLGYEDFLGVLKNPTLRSIEIFCFMTELPHPSCPWQPTCSTL